MLGLFIDILLQTGIFAIIYKYRRQLVSLINRIRLPKIMLALLTAAILIIVEEHINCGAYGCTRVILPPTLWFLLIQQLILFSILRVLQTRKIFGPVIIYCTFGMLFEFFVGAARVDLHRLVAYSPLGFIFIMVWVGFSYLFVILLPLMVLNSNTFEV